jgi:transglutaminase-like putative cysteine protease
MRSRRNAGLLIPIVISGWLFAEVTGAHGVALALVLPGCLALPSARRFEWAIPAQVLLMIGCGAVAMGLGALWPPGQGVGSEPLRPVYWTLGAGALLLSGLRLHLASPVWGSPGTLGAGLLVFLACGTVNSGPLFTSLLVLHLLSGSAALRWLGLGAGDRPRLAMLGGRHAAVTGLLISLAAGLTFTWANLLPRIYSAAYRVALDWIDDRPVTGFHDGPMPLGGLRGLLQSDEIVARVVGDAGDHLRGNAYVRYVRGRWLPALDAGERSRRTAAIPWVDDALPVGAAEVRFAKPDLDRFFLPSMAGALQLSPPRVRIDRLGVARTLPGEHPIALRLLPGTRSGFAPEPPNSDDLAVPEALAPVLDALVVDWTSETRGEGPAARIEAVEARLEAGYVYSVDFGDAAEAGLRAGREPLLDFLLERKLGHCEYFASAMTLLARADGIPARLVTGYRIIERNPFGDYAIVRERHAHAWTEVHLGERGWVTVDPSPLRGTIEAAAIRTPTLAALVDYTRVLWGRWGAEALLVVLVVGLASVQIWRLLLGRSAAPDSSGDPVSRPPDHIEALLDRLEDRGLSRAGGETLEALSRRVRCFDDEARTESSAVLEQASALLYRYAALRYGGIGSAEGLRRDVEAWLSTGTAAAGLPVGG